MAGHQKRNALQLIGERLKGNLELIALKQMIERRLQEIEEPILENDRFGRGRIRISTLG